MKNDKDWITYHLYKISADGGNSWTSQWLTADEARQHRKDGYICRRVSMQELLH